MIVRTIYIFTLVTYLLPLCLRYREYFDKNGYSHFAKWFNKLNSTAAAKVTVLLTRIEAGNISSLKGLGGGVYECRLDWGPGYRIYLGQEGKSLLILLGGGTKKLQQKDIEKAKLLWQEYKRLKKVKRYDTDT